jgi:hypothetical protein
MHHSNRQLGLVNQVLPISSTSEVQLGRMKQQGLGVLGVAAEADQGCRSLRRRRRHPRAVLVCAGPAQLTQNITDAELRAMLQMAISSGLTRSMKQKSDSSRVAPPSSGHRWWGRRS